jgi:hypothetical protein
MRKLFVYLHRDINGNVFYIGQGQEGRPGSTCDRSQGWKDAARAGYTIEVLHEVDTRNEAIRLENKYIDDYGRKDQHRGNLVNKVGGTLGMHPSYVPKKYARGERKQKPITQLSLEGVVINEWSSAKAITLELGYANSSLRISCNSGMPYKGSLWMFTNEEDRLTK